MSRSGNVSLLVGGLVIVGVVVIGGVALSSPGPAGAAVATQTNDTNWNATNGSEPVAEGCPPADALRQEVYDGLENRTVEEVRAVIPKEAVRCLPSDVRDVLNLENESSESGSSTDNSTDATNSTDSTDSTDTTNSTSQSSSSGETDSSTGDGTTECPPADAIWMAINTKLQGETKAEVRRDFPDSKKHCLTEEMKAKLNIGEGGSSTNGTTNITAGDGSGPVECPSEAKLRGLVQVALADSSPAEVRKQLPDEDKKCLPPDLKKRLGIGTNATATTGGSSGSETAPGTGSATETESGDEGTDCPSPETMREEVNRSLERVSAAQFRTMVPEDYVKCMPPDLKKRLGLTESNSTGTTGSASTDADESGRASTQVGNRDSELFDSDGDGVVNSRDHAAYNESVQYADGDGDSVPNPYDYAPRDPAVSNRNDTKAAADPGRGDEAGGDEAGGDGLPVAAGSALLLVLAVGIGAVVYRRYDWSADDGDDRLPQPASAEAMAASESSTERHDVFGESAFDPEDSGSTAPEFTFDDHEGDQGGFVFDNDPDDEDVIDLDSDGTVADEESDAGFVFEGGPSAELDDAGEPADD